MRMLTVITVVACAIGAVASENQDTAQQNAAQKERLLQALSDLGAERMTEESEYLGAHVTQDGVDIAERIAAFDAFFASHPFTEHHSENLAFHIAYGTAERTRMARFAGAFAATAVRIYWEHARPDTIIPEAALVFLERCYVAGDESILKAIADGIDDALGTNPIQTSAAFANDAAPEMYLYALQCCVSLGVFRGERSIGRWLDIPARKASFLNATGVWLFDGNALTDAHVRSLESIFKTVPQRLHTVSALYVPDAVPLSAETSPVRLPGAALDMPFGPLEVMRNLADMPPYVPLPPIPEFTALALEQVMSAICAAQLPQRPDLTMRITAFMQAAIAMPASPLAQLAPPGIFMTTPHTFMTYLGAMWMANSQALLEAALVTAEENTYAPFYGILLVADLFAFQSDSTLLFHCAGSGILSSAETALRRFYLAPGASYVNGIAVGGRLWQYDMRDMLFVP